MPSRPLLRSFLALWLVAALVLLIGSIETVREGLLAGAHVNPHLVLLGGVEAIAAALFLVPRFMRTAAAALLATIAIAFVAHIALLGQFRGDLLVYAAVVLFVAVHGPLTTPQWRAAVARRSA